MPKISERKFSTAPAKSTETQERRIFQRRMTPNQFFACATTFRNATIILKTKSLRKLDSISLKREETW